MKKLVPFRKKEESAGPARHEGGPFEVLHREMDRLFEDFLGSFGGAPRWPAPHEWGAGAIMPRFDVTETDEAVEVKAELPGMDEKDVEVTLDEETLTIKGEKKQEKEEKKRNYYMSELSYGQFHRVVPLPSAIDRDKAKATFKNGVLRLTVPKTAEARSRARTIKITAE
jgi:HSP20 family protein